MSGHIKKRVGKTGARYLVYYRRSSAHKERLAGSFKTKREAEARLDVVKGELAALRDPADLIDATRQPVTPLPDLEATWNSWMLSKRRVGPSALALYKNSRDRWLPLLGAATLPSSVTVEAVLAAVDELLDDLAPATVAVYKSHLAMVLDFADVQPNPARSKKIELPATTGEKPIPSNDEWAKIVACVAARSRGAVRLMECCGFRVSEACGLEPGDIDSATGQVLVRRAVTKTRAGRRWVPVPAELLEFVPLGLSSTQVYHDLIVACSKAGVRSYGTHALRHRRLSLWIRQGIDPVQVSRWAGHSKPSESTDTYGHTVVDAFADEWLSFWNSAYSRSLAAPSRHEADVTE